MELRGVRVEFVCGIRVGGRSNVVKSLQKVLLQSLAGCLEFLERLHIEPVRSSKGCYNLC